MSAFEDRGFISGSVTSIQPGKGLAASPSGFPVHFEE